MNLDDESARREMSVYLGSDDITRLQSFWGPRWSEIALDFKTYHVSQAYCLEIARVMRELFGISREEAISRLNRQWRKQDLSNDDEAALIFHEMPDFWANDIYYGPNSRWWKNPPGLKPLPPPETTSAS